MPFKSKDTSITILGDGGWGTTLAIHLAKKGYGVTLWGAFPRYLREVESSRENRKFLPGFHIPEHVAFEADIEKSVTRSSIIFLAIPSPYFRRVLQRIPRRQVKDKLWVSVSKGIEEKSLKLMSQVIRDVLGAVPTVVVSGPTISREVAMDIPTAVVAASSSRHLTRRVREILDTEHFTVYESRDVIGVELGGAIKNVIAIAAGIVEGLGFGSNTKSVLLARGLAEIIRLGSRMGARRETFTGLSAVGDLATTCFSIHSRNHLCGIQIGQGESIQSITGKTEMVIEGIRTTKSAYRLSHRHRIKMPIVHAVYGILFRGLSPRLTLEALMHKEWIRETD